MRPPWPGPDRIPRRGLWWAVAAGAVAVAAIVSLSIAYAASGPHHIFKTPVAGDSPSSPVPSPSSRSGSAGPELFTCFGAPAGTKCLKAPECYDADKKPTDCAGRHTWEAFLSGDLPDGVAPADADKNPRLKQVCTIALISIDSATAAGNWTVTVMVPATAGRSFRCIAGRGPNALSGPTLRIGRRSPGQ